MRFTYVFITVFFSTLLGQSAFNIDAYKVFLEQNTNLDYQGLHSMHPQMQLLTGNPVSFSDALYKDEIKKFFALNSEEINQLDEQGFMVSNRVRYHNFADAFHIIYNRDLPVYISSDAILYPLHKSYDKILMSIEREVLFSDLKEVLSGMHSSLSDMYSKQTILLENFMDIDLYICVALRLSSLNTTPVFSENVALVDTLIRYIEAETPRNIPLFSTVPRSIDFSQFTPRGHYADDPDLTAYFKTMIWLGRSELYMIPPKSETYNRLTPAQKDTLGQRQSIDAYIITELIKNKGLNSTVNEMDEILRFLVGESDNLGLSQLAKLSQTVGFNNYADLVNMDTYRVLRDTLQAHPDYGQRILSQILMSDPQSPDKIEPAVAFLLLGQRFVIDSFILGNVVHDKVNLRMLPKSADLLFSMGNDPALALLQNEIETYDYATQLAALRYLLDSYDDTFWQSTYFNLWLNVLRKLNPPENSSSLPALLKTKAWTRKTMNTQLASWAQLRHDNILYAKQSYTGGMGCDFPYAFVEPVPEFFGAVKLLAEKGKSTFDGLSGISDAMRGAIEEYFSNFAEKMQTLKSISEKEISGIAFSDADKSFLSGMLYEENMCGITFSGWYPTLFYFGMTDLGEIDYVVADVHTSPTDESGFPVGWVWHVGTGPLDLAVIVTEMVDGQKIAFAGPVMSFYEYTSINYKRLNDQEWREQFFSLTNSRPSFTADYMTNSDTFYFDSLTISVIGEDEEPKLPQKITLGNNYPNPFNAGTTINFAVPTGLSNREVTLQIFNSKGSLVRTLYSGKLPSGNFSLRWDGNDSGGNSVSSGSYFYRLSIGGKSVSGKMVMIK